MSTHTDSGTSSFVGVESRLVDVVKAPHRQKFRRWYVYKFKDRPVRKNCFPEEIEQELSQELDVYFKQSTKVVLHKDSVWIEVGVAAGYTNPGHTLIYIVHHPHSPYIFISKKVKTLTPYILQSLSTVFGSTQGIEELKLQGKDLTSLTNMALNQLSLGAFSAYRDCTAAFDSNPLQIHEAMAKRRRMNIAIKEIERKEDENVLLSIADKKTNTVGNVQRYTDVRKPVRAFQESENSSGGVARFEGIGLLLKPKTILRSDSNMNENSCNPNSDFFCYVQFAGHDIMKGFDALYTNGLISEGKELPQELHASEIISATTATAEASTSESDEIHPVFENQDLVPLWVKTS